MPSQPSKTLETFPNPHPDRDYIIEITAPEFTCLCPKTGQPDFATLHLEYVPDRLCVELKSLKLYIWSYRNEGHFHEDVTNRILNDLVAALTPRYLRLRAAFYVRGGIRTTVEVEHRRPGWQPPSPPPALARERPAEPATERGAPPAAAATPNDAAAEGTISPRQRFRMLRRSRRGAEPEPAAAEAAAVATPPPPAPKPPPKTVFVGLDFGTTGCRAVAINGGGEVLAEAQSPIAVPMKKGEQVTQDPMLWWKAASGAIQQLLAQVDAAKIHTIAVDGTSGTLLLADEKGNPVTPAILYNDQRAVEEAKRIAAVADAATGAQGPASSLAKLLWLQGRGLDQHARYALHQADWIAARLSGVYGMSDYNNCLKLGIDQGKLVWPGWFAKLGVNAELLPKVRVPGEPIGPVSGETAKLLGLAPDTLIAAGTTDGVAGFLAAGASRPGHGVTSLGSTLVLKLLSGKPVFSAEHGVYSHRLGKYWLAGGASNSGGAVLLQYFQLDQIRQMTPLLDPESFTGLDYYPLADVGERFPVNDPAMPPRLEPLPSDSVIFFQGMLEGIAQIERDGYQLLAKLGAPKLTEVWTTGGGAENPAWTRLRERILKVRLHPARSGLAAYGTALLAAGVVAKSFQ